MPKPEELVRQKIDKMLIDAGWDVIDRDDYTPINSAVAVRESLMNGNHEADYLLFLNSKAVAIIEAKREEIDVAATSKVAEQAEFYARNVPNWCQVWMDPLPLTYISNGKTLLYRNAKEPQPSYKRLDSIHTPKEMAKLVELSDPFAGLPRLKKEGLRDCQYEAVSKLEGSFRMGENKALIALATGAGKTYTACMACYRLLEYTPTSRILFLVDRNNLGKQATEEFGKFRLTENGDAFTTIFGVERLHSNTIPKDAAVVISTIQRVFSFLRGENIDDTDGDDDAPTGDDPPVTLPPNPKLPPDYFDVIIIDECHRSIYGQWKQVLDYFSNAKLVGLTATPGPETLAFFNNNMVVNYTIEQSIVDGVNVDYRIYRIKTKATQDGGAILEGDKVKKITRYNGKVEQIRQKEAKNYTPEELNRSIVNPAQIKLILETYRDAVYTEMFTDPQREPNMDYLPKTLIFALSEAHANNIVQIAKEVFNRSDNHFVQKITCTASDSNQLIRDFRNDKKFRIAVTVTLVATGTDVKPLEVVMFMRDVQSKQLYTQMLGRGCRTIGDDVLHEVTPNAYKKDCYYVVDAVGVTEHTKSIVGPSEPVDSTISLKQLLEKIAHGDVCDEYLRLLAGRLSRIFNRADEEQREEFIHLAGVEMNVIASGIYKALEDGVLPPYIDVNQPNRERKALVNPLIIHPQARKYLLILAAGFINILQPGEDTLIEKGFTAEDAQRTTSAFEQYVNENRDKIEALRIIYNNAGEPITYAMLQDLALKMRQTNARFRPALLWNNYAILSPDRVEKNTTKTQSEALTNLIQLVRYAFHLIERLTSLPSSAKRYFNLWCGQAQRDLTDKQREIISQVVDYIAANGTCGIVDIKEYDQDISYNLINTFGGYEEANEAVHSLSRFLLYPSKVA